MRQKLFINLFLQLFMIILFDFVNTRILVNYRSITRAPIKEKSVSTEVPGPALLRIPSIDEVFQ